MTKNYLVVMSHPKDKTSPMIVNQNLDRNRALRIARALNEDRWNTWNYWAISEENYRRSGHECTSNV